LIGVVDRGDSSRLMMILVDVNLDEGAVRQTTTHFEKNRIWTVRVLWNVDEAVNNLQPLTLSRANYINEEWVEAYIPKEDVVGEVEEERKKRVKVQSRIPSPRPRTRFS